MKAVDKNTVTITATLGSGGQGTVHDAEVRTAGGETRRFAYKHYRPGAAAIDYRVLDAQIGVGDRMTPHDRDVLLSSAAWPQAIVADPHHGPDGFLMGVLPPEFFLPGTDQVQAGTRPAEIQHLLNGPEFAHRLGLTYSRADQYLLIASLATLLALLHRNQIAVGDLSPKNICFRLRPRPTVFLIDCDAMVIDGQTVTRQLETPGWAVPARPGGTPEPSGTIVGDRYKLALLALRLLAGSQDTFDPGHLPADVPVTVRALIERGLSWHPDARPRADDWIELLQEAAPGADRHMLHTDRDAERGEVEPEFSVSTPPEQNQQAQQPVHQQPHSEPARNPVVQSVPVRHDQDDEEDDDDIFVEILGWIIIALVFFEVLYLATGWGPAGWLPWHR